jgi:hypothetical protein
MLSKLLYFWEIIEQINAIENHTKNTMFDEFLIEFSSHTNVFKIYID